MTKTTYLGIFCMVLISIIAALAIVLAVEVHAPEVIPAPPYMLQAPVHTPLPWEVYHNAK